jgi:thiamine-phosphate pyrophosphorylase
MSKIKKILRVIDANFNRSKEGLRVVEDVFRFVLENESLRKKARRIRHQLNGLCRSATLKKAIKQRDARNDLGKAADALEMKRRTTSDVLYVNIQRVKESTRVLEEFFKLIEPKQVRLIKSIRYELYTLEKTIFTRIIR